MRGEEVYRVYSVAKDLGFGTYTTPSTRWLALTIPLIGLAPGCLSPLGPCLDWAVDLRFSSREVLAVDASGEEPLVLQVRVDHEDIAPWEAWYGTDVALLPDGEGWALKGVEEVGVDLQGKERDVVPENFAVSFDLAWSDGVDAGVEPVIVPGDAPLAELWDGWTVAFGWSKPLPLCI